MIMCSIAECATVEQWLLWKYYYEVLFGIRLQRSEISVSEEHLFPFFRLSQKSPTSHIAANNLTFTANGNENKNKNIKLNSINVAPHNKLIESLQSAKAACAMHHISFKWTAVFYVDTGAAVLITVWLPFITIKLLFIYTHSSRQERALKSPIANCVQILCDICCRFASLCHFREPKRST